MIGWICLVGMVLLIVLGGVWAIPADTWSFSARILKLFSVELNVKGRYRPEKDDKDEE